MVRDQIAAILVLEVASQMALAITAGKDPDDWKMRIFLERSNPWEEFLDVTVATDRSPLINIWFDNTNFDRASSNVMDRQTSETVYILYCYALGVRSDYGNGGHMPGDEAAGLELARTIRLVRNILMAAEYTYLDLRGLVGSRWPQSITAFQPELANDSTQHVVAARIALRVRFNEFSPQVAAETLEFLAVDVKRLADGLVVAEADFDFTP